MTPRVVNGNYSTACQAPGTPSLSPGIVVRGGAMICRGSPSWNLKPNHTTKPAQYHNIKAQLTFSLIIVNVIKTN